MTVDPSANSTKFKNADSTGEEDFESLGEKDDRVDRVDQSLTEQGLISDRPHEKKVDYQKNEVDQQVQQEEEITELVKFIRLAIETGDREVAKDIHSVLKEVCCAGAADRQKVWSMLTEAEKVAFTALLTPTPSKKETGVRRRQIPLPS
ncbi:MULTISPECIES: hypothetical protein [unclassified Microcoleus]|uniref:hypothetical protein n=1 Tax=unclassified Microcoleus TaxID=2642155 RepID=UPI002FD41C72